MPQKINLTMVVCGGNLMFQIDGTFDKVIFHHESEAALLIEEYLRWVKSTIDIIEFPDGGVGTNWHILDKGSMTLYESLSAKHTANSLKHPQNTSLTSTLLVQNAQK